MKQNLSLIIHGKVQGVNFRSTVGHWAEKLNITGFVANGPSGTVDITAQGDKNDLDELIQLCQQGPAHAKVTNISQQWDKTNEDFSSFEIR